jgi:TPR repeat protein
MKLGAMGRPEPDTARQILERSCNAGDGLGCGLLGAQYDRGDGVTPDVHRAVALYDRACRAGDPRYCYQLAFLFLDDARVARDPARALALLRLGCDQGYDTACAGAKSVANANTIDTTEDPLLQLIRQACDSGDRAACDTLRPQGAN